MTLQKLQRVPAGNNFGFRFGSVFENSANFGFGSVRFLIFRFGFSVFRLPVQALFTTMYVKEDKFILPSFVICIPGIKADAQEKYGYHSSQSIINDPEANFEKLNVTPIEIIRELHYKIDEDFSLDLGFYGGNLYHLNLGENRNENGIG